MPKYLVTGGAGFIGSHIAERLLKSGDEVSVVDNLSTGKRENIDHLKSVGGTFVFLEGNLTDRKVAEKAVRGVDAIFHQAALGSVPLSILDPRATHHANITGTVELLIAAKEAGIKRFVNAASSSAYGETPELPKRESMVPHPLSPYAVTKLAQEEYCHAFAASYGMETISLRYFNVYGPRQDPLSQYAAVIPKFFKSCLKEKALEIFGDGEQTRDFTFVADVVEANLQAAKMKNANGQVFNVAGGKSISINTLAKKIIDLTGAKVKPKYLPARVGDIKHSLADTARAHEAFGFMTKTLLDEGLRQCLDWYRSSYVPAE